MSNKITCSQANLLLWLNINPSTFGKAGWNKQEDAMRKNACSIPCRALMIMGLLVTGLCFSPVLLTTQAASDDAALEASTPPYGNCPAPGKAGVDVCEPLYVYTSPGIAIDAPFQVIATGTGSKGPVALMELWADGKKITQVSGNLFDEPVALANGEHTVTVVELDTTGDYVKSEPFTLTVQSSTASQSCTPPGAPGVNVCEPSSPGTCHTQGWTTIIAAGTGASGSVSRMELWDNGVKLANFPGDRINTNMFLQDFDQVTIVEVDSKGNYVKSPVYTIQSC